MIRLVSSLACLLLLLLGPSPAPAQAPPVKIGTILPYTGVLSVQGTDTTHGLELYLKKIGGRAGGRAIEVVKEDTEAKPDVGLTKQYQEYGLTERLPLTGYNVLTDDTILPAIGDAALGIITVGAYSATIDTPENKAFVREYEQARGAWPSRYSEAGWVSAALITTAIDSLKGDLSDRTRVREALRAALPTIKAPRGPLTFDAYRQVISPIYVMRTEKQGNRIVNAIVDRIPAVSQEATWTWWNKP